MSDPERLEWTHELGPQMESEGEPHPVDLLARLMKSEASAGARPVPVAAPNDTNLAAPHLVTASESHRPEPIPAAARALAAPPGGEEANDPTALQRTLGAIRSALPVLQRLLPLLDGNILAALAGMLTLPQAQPQPQPKPTVDLSPVETRLADLKTQHQELRGQILTQDVSLKKLAEQMEQVREASDRYALEQEELVYELKASGKRMNVVAFLAFALLAGSIALNVVLYLQIHRLLP